MTRFMLDINGFIAETNATYVFIVRKGDLATSKVVACPEGITRATVIEIAAAEKSAASKPICHQWMFTARKKCFASARWANSLA